MLTIEEFENYKKKLSDASKELIALEAKRTQQVEYLKKTYDLTPEEAAAELGRLEKELPKREAEFEEKFKEFTQKWDKQLKKS